MEEKGRLRFPSHTGRTRSFAKPQPWIRADIFVPECRDRAASSRELQASLAFVGASESRVDRRREGWYDSVVDESWQATIENLDPSRVESLSRFTSRTETRPPSPSFFVYRNLPSPSRSIRIFHGNIRGIVSTRSDRRGNKFARDVVQKCCRVSARGNEERVERTRGTSHEMRSGNGK